MHTRNLIKCSVGILTYNSEKTLHRTLESVKDFSDIIISDGGSTDSTLSIAKEYGCTIIEQYAKLHPSSDISHPIEDFALERNRILDVVSEDWFFWLDSDEYISTELQEEVREVCLKNEISYYAYEIPIVRQSLDGTETYKDWKQTYQVRFFNRDTGGEFHRKIHEKFMFDKQKYSIGKLTGAWYVPTSKPDFPSYKKAVNYRLNIMLKETELESFFSYLKKAFLLPLKRSLGVIYRYLRLRMRYKADQVVPLGYVRNRLYSQWATFRIITSLYFKRAK